LTSNILSFITELGTVYNRALFSPVKSIVFVYFTPYLVLCQLSFSL